MANKKQNNEAMEIFREEVRSTLEKAMEREGLSAEKLASKTGLAPGTVRMLRLGKVGGTFANISILFRTLGESLDALILRVEKQCKLRGIQWPTL